MYVHIVPNRVLNMLSAKEIISRSWLVLCYTIPLILTHVAIITSFDQYSRRDVTISRFGGICRKSGSDFSALQQHVEQRWFQTFLLEWYCEELSIRLITDIL